MRYPVFALRFGESNTLAARTGHDGDGMNAWRNRGVLAAFAAALLFGAGTPIAKLLLDQTSPWLLASLLYLGSGIGLTHHASCQPGETVQS